MFFTDERLQFFKPLTSKYREQIVQCLRLLYQRQYSAAADYGQSLKREQVIEIFEEALAQSKHQVFDDTEEEQRFKNHREQSNWVLKTLIESGWVERQVDTATFQSTFPFSRLGRLFTLSLIDADNTTIRTRHRNTRNTLNALEAFASRGEIYDLLDAFDYSERIISDFSDIIAELEDKKRELVREVEAQQLVHQATDQFFDYMEKRFQPDISVRLSADSVEKHRDDIARVIKGIRRKPKDFKAKAEQSLRSSAPELCDSEQSYLWYALDTIEQRMRNASEVMLPALRRALHGFTRRADIVIRQLSFMSSQQDDDLVEVCRELSDLSEEEYSARMERAAAHLSSTRLRLIDPKHIRLLERKRRVNIDSTVHDQEEIRDDTRRELLIQQLLDQAFVFNRKDLKHYISRSLAKGETISSAKLPVENAKDLLALAHVIELASVNNLDSEFNIKVEPTGHNCASAYYHNSDEFTISLTEAKHD
jgi:hypothetical protein